jgi:phosphoribosylaminoimidazole (AIR) synthetase
MIDGAKIDEYLREVIAKGDKGSNLLAGICGPTLRNPRYVQVVREGMNGIAVLAGLPKDYRVVVHSAGGDPQISNPEIYAKSLVHNLVRGAEEIGAMPIAFTNVIDAGKIDLGEIETIGKALAESANRHNLAIMNGELAGLGDRVTGYANVSGTMVSLVHCNRGVPNEAYGVRYATFNHEGRLVFMNSDGVGTKIEITAERGGKPGLSLSDSIAMKVDDAIKWGAEVKVVSDVVETRGVGSGMIKELDGIASVLGDSLGFEYILQQERVGTRIRGYKEGIPTLNISGTAVSLIDEKTLKDLPKPSAGEFLVAIRGKPNPRSNGITDKRRIMVELFGPNWHETSEGKVFMRFLGEPSTIFYGLFSQLRQSGLATSFYHMSGGAFDGKLARPLAKDDLFVRVANLFPADWRESTIVGARCTPAEVAYAKWPMGNEGFVTTNRPNDTMEVIASRKYGLEARIVGRIETAIDGRTGVELAEVNASNGKPVYFSGKK